MANLRKTFSKIYDQYVGKIYRFIFLKVNSQEVAEDLCSETFLRGWEAFQNQISASNQNLVGGKNQKENPNSGKKIENPRAFLYRIAQNLVIDHYREKGKFLTVSAEFSPIIDPRTDLEKNTVLSSDLEQIKKALTGLKDTYQNVIIWHYLDDLPIPEVAKLLGRTEPATRVLLHRALNALRTTIKGTIKGA